MPGFDSLCNCCGHCGMCCCPVGSKERFCDCCNHCFCFGREICECCPCGADGCIGFPNHLCGCCGNCNIMWYTSCCTVCAVADLYNAASGSQDKGKGSPEAWSNIVCTVVTGFIIVGIIQALPNIIGASINLGQIFQGVASIIEMVMYIYLAVIFGYSAGQILKKSKTNVYEPEECCNGCHDDGCGGCFSNCMKCCSSWQCCCAYCCCFELHLDQVARFIETDKEMQDVILEGRPEQCKCCNCWDTAEPLELTTSGTNTMVQ